MRQSRLCEHWSQLHSSSKPSCKPDPAAVFPAEVLAACFSFLSPADLVSAYNVSRGWRVAFSPHAGPNLWKMVFLRDANYEHSDIQAALQRDEERTEFVRYMRQGQR
ncbi:uncharacterized protein LOC62_07G009735 [Vanrija pseudolonga]|uniref:F-box domain-containing protein n=1 Tax=Vanrija pseudolonga TaxID=143232 RepID=A0AAF0YKU2_9TREE|nr:hypothetical protein LOC62_07G009735 [Vanrija pseudolonga]WOO86251.1 hypothetical protein LOC62_07G009735 [Vanrija pseudolonga]